MADTGERWTPTLIVGAGPAGLAVAGSLRALGEDFEILEATRTVGSSWRNHYKRLHLHTAKRYSALPGYPFPDSYPRYPSRLQIVEYLENYAERFDLRPNFEREVAKLHREKQEWLIEVKNGQPWRAPIVVIASGYNAEPSRPGWPAQDKFRGRIIHSSQYSDGQEFQGQNVLVVGFGNSGGEIAIDLHEHGARPYMAVRGPVHVMPRDLLGLPIQSFSLILDRLPVCLVDRIGLIMAKLQMGSMAKYGLKTPTIGPATQLKKFGRVPLIDVGTIDLIRQGAIQIRPNIKEFNESGVIFEDGQELPVSTVVLATGYRVALETLFEDVGKITNDRGHPRFFGTRVTEPGFEDCYFVGFRNPSTGALREIAIEAERIAQSIQEVRAVQSES